MRILDTYSHKNGQIYVEANHASELLDVMNSITSMDAEDVFCKRSREKGRQKLLFHPSSMNNHMQDYLFERGWLDAAPDLIRGFREPQIKIGDRQRLSLDGLKNKVGIEIEFGKYAFAGYDVLMKAPIFRSKGKIDSLICVVPMPSLVKQMSTGVCSFQQIKSHLMARGEADIDVPLFVLGLSVTEEEQLRCDKKSANLTQVQFAINRKTKPGPKPADLLFA